MPIPVNLLWFLTKLFAKDFTCQFTNKNRSSAKIFNVWADWVTKVLLFLEIKKTTNEHAYWAEETPSSETSFWNIKSKNMGWCSLKWSAFTDTILPREANKSWRSIYGRMNSPLATGFSNTSDINMHFEFNFRKNSPHFFKVKPDKMIKHLIALFQYEPFSSIICMLHVA